MESSVRTNRLAIVSFVGGLIVIALLAFGLYWSAFPASPGSWNTIRTILDLSVSVQYLCAPAALLTGILALRALEKKAERRKAKC